MNRVASARSMPRSAVAVCGLRSAVCGLWSVVRRSCFASRRPLSASSGFTLLEVIIAFTILGLMSGLIFSSFRMSLNSYEKSQERLDVEARKRVLQDLIKRQIGSLFPVRPSASFLDLQAADAQQTQQTRVFAQMPLFSGTSEAVTFATVAPLMLQENPGLTIVHYGLAQDEWGNTYLGAAEASYMGLESFMSMLDPPTRTPLALIEDIVDLSFQYYGFDPQSQSYDWFDSWNGEELLAIPLAIRIDYDENHILVPINASFTGSQFRQGMQRFIQGR
ncbi:MAG: type II secretion system protein [Acidobacteria bacterium]|nr:type II secretion system protein [Acidobacteriota bacterium]